jgi:hypothetical protein
MNTQRQAFEKNLYNKTQIFSRIQAQMPEPKEEMTFMKNAFKLAFVAILGLSGFLAYQILTPKSVSPVFASISVDINPSFELLVDYENTIIEVIALNEDAQSMDTSSLVGMSAESAVSSLINLATEAGFILTDDEVEDYVLVTTVILDEAESIADEEEIVLQEDLETLIEDDVEENIVDTKVYLLKSDRQEKFLADEKEIPVGLYIINGMIEQEDGSIVSVKDFMANSDNVAAIENRINQEDAQYTQMIERYLAELIELGVDVGVYQEQFAAGTDLDLLVETLELALENAGGSLEGQYLDRNIDNLSLIVDEYMTQLIAAGIDVSTYQTRIDAGEDLGLIKDELEVFASTNNITLDTEIISEAMKEEAQANADENKAEASDNASENQAEASESGSGNQGKGKN